MESKGKSRMIISEKQQDANRQNAQHSTGPKTPGGKAAMRLRALKYGLRARSLLIPGENPEDYKQLWADLEAEWQPQTRTERMHLEQAAVSQWLLARVAESESRLYQEDIPAERQFVLLGYASIPHSVPVWKVPSGMPCMTYNSCKKSGAHSPSDRSPNNPSNPRHRRSPTMVIRCRREPKNIQSSVPP
jgi:hypothetical protein